MSTYQRVALFIFFDSVERDLTNFIRQLPFAEDVSVLNVDEAARAAARLERREGINVDPEDHLSLLPGLDLGEKYPVLMRHRALMDQASREYYEEQQTIFGKAIPIRNAVMHGRPLTTVEFATGFSIAKDLITTPLRWPTLANSLRKYDDDPGSFYSASISILEEDLSAGALHNLPIPDYEDTGFFPRPELEKDLRKKILGRHPVITVLGEGGTGKTALTLQTLYGILASNDHPFDAIAWVSAKANRLSVGEVERIEGAITTSLGLLTEVVDQFEPSPGDPISRVRRLMEDNSVLLVIDNLETVLDQILRELASDVPGSSKLLFTSRVPLGSDLSVQVGDFNEKEARGYLRRVIDTYDITALVRKSNDQIDKYANRLNRKPLLLKWFALGVAKGLDPDIITQDPSLALQFCMENVIDRLSEHGKTVASAMASASISLSAPLLEELTELSPIVIERSIAELLQFGLIQRDDRTKNERVYILQSFARSYITRVIKISPDFSGNIANKLRSVEAIYQEQRGGLSFNRYNSRAFLVRSRSEALAARKLKTALEESNKGSLSKAEEILDELRVSSSDYFEFHRTNAFVARKAGDIPRAIDSYEAALEIAENQPQLHVFYAGLLSREMADYGAAIRHLERALELDPDVPYVLQEAARNAFFVYDFARAKELIDRAGIQPSKTPRDATIFADLRSQLHYREAEYLSRSGDLQGAALALEELTRHLDMTPLSLFDEKHLEHLRKSYRLISELRRPGAAELAPILDALTEKIEAIDREAGPDRRVGDVDPASSEEVGAHTGRLRVEGRRSTFGFLRNSQGNDCFVSRTSVGEEVWSKLCSGARASYEVTIGSNGKSYAINVSVY